MFRAHTSKIDVQRCEPVIDDLNAAIQKVLERNSALTKKIVLNGLIKSPKSKSKVQQKILSLFETDERRKRLTAVIVTWNEWRQFYSDEPIPEWTPKTKGQLTCLENIVEMAQQNELNLNIFIACCFKAYEKRYVRLSLQIALSQGLEFYDKWHNQVMYDYERLTYDR